MSSYFVTGSSSGIGKEFICLLNDSIVHAPTRQQLDLDDPSNVIRFNVPHVDFIVHFAGHDIGGGVNFFNHSNQDILKILNCNLLSTVLLSKVLYEKNPNCTQVLISSTNLDKFYPKNLVYNLSKKSIKTYMDLLKLDYPKIKIKEARIGLTKTSFNKNRHKNNHKPINDLYSNPHMSPRYVAEEILRFIKSDKDFIRINEKQV